MVTKPFKVCILGASFNTGNMGVSVLTAGALRCVLHTLPQAEIIQLDYGRTSYGIGFEYNGQQVPVSVVNIRFSKELFRANHIFVLILLALVSKLVPLRIIRRSVCRNRVMKEVFGTDLVLSLAAGDSFSDIYGFQRLLYISLPQILAVLTCRRMVLLPQTIGPFRHRVSKAIARWVLTHAEVIYSRDHIGQRATRRLLGLKERDQRVRFCYDLGFDVDAVRTFEATVVGLAEKSGDAPIIGVNVSGLLMMGGYSRNNMFALKADYDVLMLRLVEYFVKEQRVRVMLVPHVFGTGDESDVRACEAVFSRMQPCYEGMVGVVRNANNYGEVKYLIGQCDFFVGARMHACIAALSQHVPAVSIAYSDKFLGVMETIDLQDLVVDPREMDEDEIVHSVAQAFTRRGEVRRALEHRIPLVKQAIRRVLADVDFAEGHNALMQND